MQMSLHRWDSSMVCFAGHPDKKNDRVSFTRFFCATPTFPCAFQLRPNGIFLNRERIVSSLVCNFDFVPAEELAEDGSFDGRVVVEAADGPQPLTQRANEPLQGIVGAYSFPLGHG